MRRKSRFAELLRSDVVVHLKAGRSMTGVLQAEYDDCIALVHAHLLDPEIGPTALDGEQLVRWEEIAWTQILARPAVPTMTELLP